jgi:hypothetical protein
VAPFSQTLRSPCASPRPAEPYLHHWTAILLRAQVPDPPMESPTRRAYRPASYQTPRGPGQPKGRRKTVRWTLEVRQSVMST